MPETHAKAESGPAAQRPRRAWIVAAVVLAWGALVLATLVVSITTGNDIQLCTFRRVTGYPCPTCGSTRVVYALAMGHFRTALELNPFTTALIVLAPPIALGNYVWRRGRPPLSQRTHALIAAAIVTLLAINWWYITRPGSLTLRPTSALAERWKQKAAEVPEAPHAD